MKNLAKDRSIYVHLDWHVGHHVKVMMDEIFGYENFRNEVVWRYRRQPAISKDFQKMHDVILRYSKSPEVIGTKYMKSYQNQVSVSGREKFEQIGKVKKERDSVKLQIKNLQEFK